MKVRLIAVFSLIVAVALLLASGIQPTQAQPPKPVNEIALTVQDAGRQVDLDGNHLLTLNLEGNPSTGYSWQVQRVNAQVLRQVGDVEFTPGSGQIGAPGLQTIRFEGVAAGQTELTLVYSRPWEKDVRPKTFSIQVQSRGAYQGVRPVTSGVDDAILAKPPKVTPTPQPGLPSAFSWCDQGKCTSVRDQGQCGSCWAFSTVGALESAIKIATGSSKDLSEQYLVSCNSDGWGCNGGWYAHDYHQWKYIAGEPGPGAVYETDFHYQAQDVPCNPPHTHNEQISTWQYVGSSNGVPSISAIKQAIYDHGPVSAAVYVGLDFQRYTSGVFTTRQKGTVNHAIVLVGWDDSQGYWILRNSWGTSWGESGYMRIKYGTSNVGYAASYVVFP